MRIQVSGNTIVRVSNEYQHREMLTNRNIPDMTHRSIGKHVSRSVLSGDNYSRCQNIKYNKSMEQIVIHEKYKNTRDIINRLKKMKL
ncbi:hypothetical protein [Tannockella kyphosi]|uniref:hypothetical protein n=1 Tax=Tannockella kyphosi TaxID=2899121 RepID=UPI0020126FEC|nr:hypothetical protein [Tannockella kyphosi]